MAIGKKLMSRAHYTFGYMWPHQIINEIAPATATATEDKITATKITLFSHVQL